MIFFTRQSWWAIIVRNNAAYCMKPSFMALVLVLLLPLGCVAPVTGNRSLENLISAPDSRVSIYEVPLRCPLVDGLGCGSMAKPFLTELERKPIIAEAWMNHSGTRVMVVWKADASQAARAQVAEDVGKITTLEELSGATRHSALQSVRSGSGWYRADTVDELSREEAESVARRLIESVNAAEPLSDPQRKHLMRSFTDTLKRHFIHGELSNQEVYDELLNAARKQLDAKGVETLDKTIRKAVCAPPC